MASSQTPVLETDSAQPETCTPTEEPELENQSASLPPFTRAQSKMKPIASVPDESACHLRHGSGFSVCVLLLNFVLITFSLYHCTDVLHRLVPNARSGSGKHRTPARSPGGGDRLANVSDEVWRREWAYAHGRSREIRTFLRWLHIPKTGTSFVNTLIRWGCPQAPNTTFIVPRKERPADMALRQPATFSWDWLFMAEAGRHWLSDNCRDRLVTGLTKPRYALNMHRAMGSNEAGRTIALFRLPRQRMISNYLHLAYHYNSSRTPKRSLGEYLQKREFWSQQTKLMLGLHYRASQLMTRAQGLEAAQLVMNELRFVGLTEEFALSVRLFHAVFGGVPHGLQFENVRPGIRRFQHHARMSFAFRYDEDQLDGWFDPPDELVYKAAWTRFWTDVCRLRDQIEVDGLGAVFAPLCYVPLFSPKCSM